MVDGSRDESNKLSPLPGKIPKLDLGSLLLVSRPLRRPPTKNAGAAKVTANMRNAFLVVAAQRVVAGTAHSIGRQQSI